MDSFRVISLQSPSVVDKIKSGIYKADASLSREKRDYRDDMIQLNDNVPIWVYDMFSVTQIEEPSNWILPLSWEMGIDGIGFSDFVLLELDVPYDMVKPGITHNTNRRCLVLPEIRREWLVATYMVYDYYDDDDRQIFDVTRIEMFGGDSIFPDKLKSFHVKQYYTNYTFKFDSDLSLVNKYSKCSTISDWTPRLIYNGVNSTVYITDISEDAAYDRAMFLIKHFQILGAL